MTCVHGMVGSETRVNGYLLLEKQVRFKMNCWSALCIMIFILSHSGHQRRDLFPRSLYIYICWYMTAASSLD